MKIINMPFLAALLLVGTGLVARAAMQGVELAVVLTASEYGYSWAKRLSRWARTSFCLKTTSQTNAKSPII
jgi:hypothetical protein